MGDATTANRVIAQLGVLLREAFASPNEHDASLAAEVAFTRRYLEIAQLRFGSRLNVVEHIDPMALSTRVPRFVLQPLVENAIIHGIATREQGGQLAIDVSRDNGTVVIRVKDNGSGLPAAGAAERGMGLPIVRERLRQLYGDAAVLTVANAGDSGVVAELHVPAAPESAASSTS
jgi:LytS/YehU family sensor histidine kinase